MIAALFVEKNGVYYDPALTDVDPWDEERDARKYAGPWPVVAHPPCSRWCQLARVNEKRYGHKVGDDGGCFAAALASVRKFGGVLEHPRGSRLYDRIPKPGEMPDRYGGWSVEVDQLHWGHVAHKRTWLYFIGVRRDALTAPPFPDREPTHDLMGGRGRNATADRGGRLEASKELRRRTPVLFAEWLVGLARAARIETRGC